MKILTLIISMMFIITPVMGAAPYGIKGQNQTTLYSNVHQFPNNQVTNIGGINALVENGNRNILVNPSFEHVTFSTGWTLAQTAGTFASSVSLTVFQSGLKSAVLTATSGAGTFLQSSTLNAANMTGRTDGYWAIWIKAGAGADFEVCSYIDGAASGCKAITASTTKIYESNFTYGSTSNGIIVRTKSTHTGVVTIDDSYVGVTPGTVQASLTNYISAPGMTAPKTCFYAFGGASATLAAPTVCSTGTCVEVYDSCGAATPPTFSAAGVYLNLTFANGTFANSTFLDCKTAAFGAASVRVGVLFNDTSDQDWATTASGGAVLNVATYNSAMSATNGYVAVKCVGAAP